MTPRKFALGQLVATPAAFAALAAAGQSPADVLARHVSGDWGDVDSHDALLNDDAVREGGRILSAYLVGGDRVWVITEADRSSTCVLLASEY